MSSHIQDVEIRSSDARMLRTILKNAGYVTAKMAPLNGPLHQPSEAVLQRFMSGTMQESRA
ncbi:hypothetical protein [Mycoplana dimorpha]|uniref:Uncharacterized protein n=1 Tax=Mycoplana dimorpha TaxID=28320 RepID=A0A2T5B337_MYCDI|nr:hypothetical protein [Mycoplana dimorpha]PTM93388.1 hypothetical protein C7449_10673 [Mycoplana dimorpha]